MAVPAHADFNQAVAWFQSLDVDARANLQGNLVLLAHYGGLVDAQFGTGTYNAIASWQASQGLAPTGIISATQSDLLDQMAAEAMSQMGMDLVEDLDGRLSIMLPMGMLTQRQFGPAGTSYHDVTGRFEVETFWRPLSAGSIADQYAGASSSSSHRSVSYSRLRDELYVVTGVTDGKYFYELVHAAQSGAAGFRFTYGEEFRQVGGIASVFAASYSMPNDIVANVANPSVVQTPTPAPSASYDLQTSGNSTKKKTAIPDGSLSNGVNSFGSFVTFDEVPGLLALVGDIGPKTPLDMRRAMNSMTTPAVLALASDGGNVASALMVAYEVREAGLSTYVAPDSGCYSACAFVFLAGQQRVVEGELGVHQVWGEGADASSAQTVVSDILEAFGEFGVRQEVISAMLRTQPEDMYVFSSAELADWSVITP